MLDLLMYQILPAWNERVDDYDEYEELASAFLKLVDEAGKVPGDFMAKRSASGGAEQ